MNERARLEVAIKRYKRQSEAEYGNALRSRIDDMAIRAMNSVLELCKIQDEVLGNLGEKSPDFNHPDFKRFWINGLSKLPGFRESRPPYQVHCVLQYIVQKKEKDQVVDKTITFIPLEWNRFDLLWGKQVEKQVTMKDGDVYGSVITNQQWIRLRFSDFNWSSVQVYHYHTPVSLEEYMVR